MLFLFSCVCASMLLNLILLAALGAKAGAALGGVKILRPKAFEERVLVNGTDSSSKVAVIPLDGVIAFGGAGSLGDSMVEDFKAALEQAEADKQIKAVVLQVDSPGGEITASDVLYDAICRLARHKPVVVYFNSIGASGAYYAACGSNWIMCNSTTFTGSIGVIISTLNYRDLFGKIGLQSVVFKSGKFKDMLNGAREMTPEEKAYVQGLVMQSYDRFVGIVARSRKLDEKFLREGVADGRILSGTDAYASKLVDELGYIEDAYNKAAELGGAPQAEVVKYERNYSFDKFFRMFGESRAAAKIELDLLPKTMRLEPGRVYLLPAFFAP
ncbi:MAG: signal peptide peptidase SppA [Verrucomicrobiae bacterium]